MVAGMQVWPGSRCSLEGTSVPGLVKRMASPI